MVIVVSAMSKVTDLLLDTMRHAEAGDRRRARSEPAQAATSATWKPAASCCRRTRSDGALAGIHELIGEFERIADGMLMLGERPPRSVDEAVAIGERLSALLIAAYLESQGTPAAAVNAAERDRHRRRVRQRLAADGADAREGARSVLLPLLEQGVLPVVTGFNGATAGRPADHAGPRRIGFLGIDPGGRAGRRGALDLDRCGRHHDAPIRAWCRTPRCWTKSPTAKPPSWPTTAPRCCIRARWRRWSRRQIPVWSKNSFAPEKPGTQDRAAIRGAERARAR